MKRFGIFLLIMLISVLIAGAFGILHDQITYSICPEYFTKFKFYQFGLVDVGNEATLPNPRLAVATVGFLATWWTGIFIGIGLGLTGQITNKTDTMFSTIIRAICRVLIVTIGTGIVGYFYARWHLVYTEVDWWFPPNLIHKTDFIIVGSIHNFSYLGGALGLIVGIGYMILRRPRSRRGKGSNPERI